MNSIYKQLDKIDDNKSLNEKWNVKNQRELKKLKENFKVRQYSLDWDDEYEWADEETFDTMEEAQIRFNELKEVIDNGEFDYAAIALVDENDNDISIYGEPERQKVTKEDVIEYLRDREEVSLTDEEFDYVVEDLWDAIWREMREGSRYETIDDVDMVELIDASDNPTHDLCYKLMGLLDDEEELDESIQGSDEAIEFAREYILDQHSWNDYDTHETESEFSITLWCGDEWDGDESEVKYKMSIEKLIELKDDEAAFEEYIDSCENSIDYEAAGNEFYRRAEEELNKHFNCTGAFLEPSTQLGQGRTFLFADDMRFDGSFDFQTGEDYIREDNFEGFLKLCKDSFTVVTDD